MIIKMTIQMSGGRYDDQPWPPPGVDFEVPDGEGEALVRDRNAVKVRDSSKPPSPEPPVRDVPVSEPAATAAGPVISEDDHDSLEAVADGTEEPQAQEEPEPPAPTASKQDWVDYAVSHGASSAEASSLTKNQLQQAYGGRLLS